MIELGTSVATLRKYNLFNPEEHRRSTANPYAPGMSSQGAYAELDGWAEWTADDWSSGTGHRKPDAGAFNAISTTIFPNRIMLPLAPKQVDSVEYAGFSGTDYETVDCGTINVGTDYAASRVTMGVLSGGVAVNPTKYAIRIEPSATTWAGYFAISFYGYLSPDATLTCRFRSGVTLSTSTLIETKTLTGTRNAPACSTWNNFVFTEVGAAVSGTYWIELEITADTSSSKWYEQELVSGTVIAGSIQSARDPGAATYANTTDIPLFRTSWYRLNDDPGTTVLRQTAVFNNKVYRAGYYTGVVTSKLFVKNFASISGFAETLDLAGANITSLTVWEDKLYIGTSAGNARVMTTAEITTDPGFAARMMTAYKGYLWRVTNTNVISYSTDAATWTTVGTFYPITNNQSVGLVGMGNNLYICTENSLFFVAPGDFIQHVVDWNSSDILEAGRSIVSAGDALYVLVDAQTIYRIDQGHQISNIMANNNMMLQSGRTPTRMAAIKDFLCVATARGSGESPGNDLYLYRDAAWHYLAEVPSAKTVTSIVWDEKNKVLVIACAGGENFYYSLANMTIDFSYMTSPFFAKNGWIEYDRFDAGKPTLAKEWESVILAWLRKPYTAIELYAKVPMTGAIEPTLWLPMLGFNTVPAWNATEANLVDSLRSVNAPVDYGGYGRYATEWIKLGLRFSTQRKVNTPILESATIKYLPMVTDKYQWTLAIPVSGNQQLANGTINPYTAAQQIAHLDSMTKSEVLIYFKDIDGVTYTCKVLSENRVPLEYDLLPAGEATYAANIPYLYQLTIEQFGPIVA